MRNAASETASGGARERDDGAVVVAVALGSENGDTRDAGPRVDDGGDDFGTTTFGKVRHAFDELHRTLHRRKTASDAQRSARRLPSGRARPRRVRTLTTVATWFSPKR
jgi:hypothetical protein